MNDEIEISFKEIVFLVLVGIGGIIALVFLFGSWTKVNPGEKAIVLRLGKINRTIDQGVHGKIPLLEQVEKINIQTQKEEANADAASSDLQTVNTTVAVNWNIDPQKIVELYSTVGKNFKTTIIDPSIQEVVKSVTARYTAEQLITKRPQVTEDIQKELSHKLLSNSIIVTGVSIVNFNFSSSFNAAIEAKVTAEQQALASKNKLEQVKYEAEQRIVQSKAEAEAIRIQAEALKENSELVELEAVKKWNGILPQYMTGATPFINLK